MKNRIFSSWRIAILLTLLALQPGRAAAGVADVSVHATIDSTLLWLGEQTRIRLQLTQGEGDEVWLQPTFSDTLVRGIEVLEVTRPDTTRLGSGRLQIDRSLLITSFDSGFFYIPPFLYLAAGDTLFTEPLSIKILPVDVDAEGPIVDIKDIRRPASAWWLVLWDSIPSFVWILLGLLLLLGAGVYAWLEWRKRQTRPEVAPEDLLPPHEKALLALSQLRDEKLWQEGREKEYYTYLTDILREYLEGRFGIQAMEMTSEQILEHLRAEKDTRRLDRQLREILEMADFVKFAKMRPQPDDNEAAMRNAVAFVEDTRPTPEIAAPAEAATLPSAAEAPSQPDETEPKTATQDEFEKYGPQNKNR